MGRPRQTTETFIEKAQLLHGNRYQYNTTLYVHSHSPVLVMCDIHGEFSILPYNHIKKHSTSGWNAGGCPSCGKITTVTRNKDGLLTREEYEDRAISVHGSQYAYVGDYRGLHQKIEIECPTHGQFLQSADNHLRGSGCPRCKNSKGSRKVAATLDRLGLSYVREHKFDDCRGDKYPLVYDFWIESIKTLIEFDGEQHFKPVRFSEKVSVEKSREMFLRVQRYDNIKNQYCIANNLQLIRVAYTVKNVESFLEERLN